MGEAGGGSSRTGKGTKHKEGGGGIRRRNGWEEEY